MQGKALRSPSYLWRIPSCWHRGHGQPLRHQGDNKGYSRKQLHWNRVEQFVLHPLGVVAIQMNKESVWISFETGFGETGGVDYPTARGLYVGDLINGKGVDIFLPIYTHSVLSGAFFI